MTAWESHFGTACRGVNWEKHSLSDLRAAVTCIGGVPLASICRRLTQDYRSWSSGMPDLLLWRLHDCCRGEAKLVEVKGPNDRLSEQQRAWLLVLIDCGFSSNFASKRFRWDPENGIKSILCCWGFRGRILDLKMASQLAKHFSRVCKNQ